MEPLGTRSIHKCMRHEGALVTGPHPMGHQATDDPMRQDETRVEVAQITFLQRDPLRSLG